MKAWLAAVLLSAHAGVRMWQRSRRAWHTEKEMFERPFPGGPLRCGTHGCPHPVWRDRLCQPCWTLATTGGRDPRKDGTPPTPPVRPVTPRPSDRIDWDHVEAEAARRGVTVVDVLCGRV